MDEKGTTIGPGSEEKVPVAQISRFSTTDSSESVNYLNQLLFRLSMATITIAEEKFNRILNDVEVLIEDVVSILDQDEIAKKRMAEVKATPSIGNSEAELDTYLKKRGVKVD